VLSRRGYKWKVGEPKKFRRFAPDFWPPHFWNRSGAYMNGYIYIYIYIDGSWLFWNQPARSTTKFTNVRIALGQCGYQVRESEKVRCSWKMKPRLRAELVPLPWWCWLLSADCQCWEMDWKADWKCTFIILRSSCDCEPVRGALLIVMNVKLQFLYS